MSKKFHGSASWVGFKEKNSEEKSKSWVWMFTILDSYVSVRNTLKVVAIWNIQFHLHPQKTNMEPKD